jgi:hypothetical protein
MADGEIACCRLGMRHWLEWHREPPLCRVAGDEVYRIIYEPCWDEHVSVCITRCGDEITFRRVILASLFGPLEGIVEGVLSIADWQHLADALGAADFWSLPRHVPQQGATLDGYEIIVEGRRGNLFKFVQMPNPDTDETWRIGRVAFDLVGLAEMRL